jgi:hypothetical protein
VKCLRLPDGFIFDLYSSAGSLGPVVDLSGEVTASADLFVGDFGVTGFLDDYVVLYLTSSCRSFHE